MKRKICFWLVTAIVMLSVPFSVFGSGKAEASDGAKTEGSRGIIGVTIPTAQSTFCASFADGAVKAIEEAGYQGVINDPEVKIDQQIAALENFVATKAKGVVVFPVDGNGINDAAVEAMKTGLKIMAFDNTMSADFRIAENEKETGRFYAQPGIDWVKNKMNGKAEIAILTVKEPEDSRNGRIFTGMKEAVEQQLPNSKIVSIQKSVDSAETMTLIENIVQANPNVNLIICNLDGIMAAEALNALGHNGDDVFLVDCSGLPDALNLIKSGSVLQATIVTDIYKTGYNAAKALVQMLDGQSPDPVDVSKAIVTRENVDQYLQ